MFSLNENSNFRLCVKFYYYNSGSPVEVTSANQLSIDANTTSEVITGPSGLRSAMSNFTVTAQPSNFSIGESASENEGILVEYEIHADANSNGTYILNLGWLAPQIEKCWVEFDLVVGSGSPNFLGGGTTCQTLTQSGGSNNSNYPSGILFAEVVGYSRG